ncbi:hypothetical protein, partial [Rouxiella badensis]|uniref:hypothetical protein n=1 Tax=Rouxiella badensis TaxID=1646377 RepID=UPI0028D2245D
WLVWASAQRARHVLLTLKDFNRKSGSGPLPHKSQKQLQCSIQPPWHVPLTKKNCHLRHYPLLPKN